MLGKLLKISERLINATSISNKRYLYDTIDWKQRLICIIGARGTGKTTMLLQRLKSVGKSGRVKVAYLSLDNIYFYSNTVFESVSDLYDQGVKLIVLDEVHKYGNWSLEIKNLYDSFPDIKLIITGSSALNLVTGSGDLSRRLSKYELYGMSFREFLEFEGHGKLKVYTLDKILSDYDKLSSGLADRLPINKLFRAYLKYGYYPIYLESKKEFDAKLNSILTEMIEVDISSIFNVDYTTVRQVKKLLSIISASVPYEPNISKLSSLLSTNRNQVLMILDYLSKCSIIHLLKGAKKLDSILSKPDKIYLNDTNYAHAIVGGNTNIGNLRETFMLNQLSKDHIVSTPKFGDFIVDNKYVFEVGGPSKTFDQISGVPNSYLALDSLTSKGENKIPIWLFGFMY